MAYRKIIHIDLDAFFCAVEELRRPDLGGKPFAVGGNPQERGVVSSCSYAARQLGVRSAMPMGHALRLCPGLIIVPPDHTAYHHASVQVMELVGRFAPLVEQISIDEAFLDVTDLPQPGLEIAGEIQQSIRSALGLPCSLGIASNKLVAKIATDVGKGAHKGTSPPCAIRIVAPGEEAAFLAPLPVQMLWGVGPKTAAHLGELGICTIGDLALQSEMTLLKLFGKNGHDLWKHSRGMDERPVEAAYEVKSISQEITFSKDVSDSLALERTLCDLSSQVGYRLRQQGLRASTVRLKIRWPDFSTHTRQLTLSQPADQDQLLYGAALRLFHSVWSPGKSVRLIGVGVSHLLEEPGQLSLWDTVDEKERRLLIAMDELQQRYGKKVVRRGTSRSRRS